MPKKTFLVTSTNGENCRLDVFLSENIKDLSRMQIKKMIEEKAVRVNGGLRRSSYRLKCGDRIEVSFALPKPEKVYPENIPIKVVYNDNDIIIIDKESGLVVHPGARKKKSTLVNALLYRFPEICQVGPEDRPGIVHRLDKETSGLIVVAKSNNAYRELQRQFKSREVGKTYFGLVRGKISRKEGTISWPIGRHRKNGAKMSVKTKNPRLAETHYTVIKEFKDHSLIEIKPTTGRTHQIRVHFSAAGHPLVGDSKYGRPKTKSECSRLFLHACRLAFFHPKTKEKVEFSSPLPQDLHDFLNMLEAEANS